MPARSFARLDLLVPAIDSAHLAPSLPLHSCLRADASLVVVDFTHLGSASLLRSFARLGAPTAALGAAAPESFLPLQGPGCLGLTLAAKGLLRCGAPSPFPGAACVDLSPMALDFGHSDASFFLQSFARPGLPSSVPGASVASSLSLQSSQCAEASPFACGIGRSGFLPLVTDFAQLDLPSSIRSFCWVGTALAAMDVAGLGLLLPSHRMAWLGSSSPACGLSHFDSSPFAVDRAMCGPSPPLHSSAQPGLAASACTFALMGLSLLLQNLA
ncbi:unnamed protein product [Effrenium voratum]|uniref:Uncharacterized protein n=1 Tax=Effrenium voratum TaxID=2562239 RepID=A0AA36JRG6_9DINO|nr:unnamed protein product [Effrenium voratum]